MKSTWAVALVVLSFSGCVRTPAEPDVGSVSEAELHLVFLGDIMAHDVNYRMQDYSRIYRYVSHLFNDADYVFGQLEFVIDPDRPQSSYPRFNVHPPYVEAAVGAGVRVFSVANNHSTDFGEAGVEATLGSMQELARQEDVWFSGLNQESGESRGPVSLPHDGFAIGFYAVTRLLNDTSGADLVAYVPRYDLDATARFLRTLTDWTRDFDLFILSVHDGIEYSQVADGQTVSFMTAAADAGVDIVWGHHPHVLQQWFVYDRDGDSRSPAVIMPSMGNFVSGQTWQLTADRGEAAWAATGDSAVVRVIMRETPAGLLPDRIEADMITHLRDPAGGVTVRLLDGLFEYEDLDNEWREFYRTRMERNQHFTRSIQVGTEERTGE